VIPVFDGHNDALTRDDHHLLADGRPDGHLDIPRMRAGGVRGAIFAVFTPSADDEHQLIERDDGVVEVLPAAEVAHDYASGYATAVCVWEIGQYQDQCSGAF